MIVKRQTTSNTENVPSSYYEYDPERDIRTVKKGPLLTKYLSVQESENELVIDVLNDVMSAWAASPDMYCFSLAQCCKCQLKPRLILAHVACGIPVCCLHSLNTCIIPPFNCCYNTCCGRVFFGKDYQLEQRTRIILRRCELSSKGTIGPTATIIMPNLWQYAIALSSPGSKDFVGKISDPMDVVTIGLSPDKTSCASGRAACCNFQQPCFYHVPHSGSADHFHGPVKLVILGERGKYTVNMAEESVRRQKSIMDRIPEFAFWRNFRPNPFGFSLAGSDNINEDGSHGIQSDLFFIETNVASTYCGCPHVESDEVEALRLKMKDFFGIHSCAPTPEVMERVDRTAKAELSLLFSAKIQGGDRGPAMDVAMEVANASIQIAGQLFK